MNPDLRSLTDSPHQPSAEPAIDSQLGEWLDSTKISTFHLCPRKYYYRFEQHLVPRQITSKEGEEQPQLIYASATQFGIALHAALASYYIGHGMEESTCPCPSMEGCEFCKGSTIPRMAAQFLIHYPYDPLDDRDPRTRQRGIEILHAYVDKYRRESFQEVIGVEIPFTVPFYTNDDKLLFLYIGRIDLLVKEGGVLKPIDHKSTTRFGQLFEQQFKVSVQCTGYMRSTHQILLEGDITADPILSMGINAIRITTKITDESFMRITTTRDEESFQEWEQEIRDTFSLIQRYRNNGQWPKHAPFACAAYNHTCEYYSLCSSGAQLRQELIESNYEKIPWLPVE